MHLDILGFIFCIFLVMFGIYNSMRLFGTPFLNLLGCTLHSPPNLTVLMFFSLPNAFSQRNIAQFRKKDRSSPKFCLPWWYWYSFGEPLWSKHISIDSICIMLRKIICMHFTSKKKKARWWQLKSSIFS